MKQPIFWLLCSVILISSCQNRISKRMFEPEALLSQHVILDVTRDTIFKTKNGIIVRIPAGSLQSTGNNIVELEVKEALTIGDMIRSGIATQSNGKPLASAGLIFINTVGEDPVRISKPISIAIPTTLLDDSMKLFKGELDIDSNMNWIDPKPMRDNPQVKAMQWGKSLFINNCASCHAIDKKMSGPELAHIVKRSKPVPFGEEGYVQNGHNLLYDFTRNNQAVLKWSLYYRCLYNQYNKMPMNVFPDLTETDLNNLYSYIENESEVRRLPVPDNGIEKCLDSCLLYAEARIRLKQMKSGFESDSSMEGSEDIIFAASRKDKDTSQNKRVVVTRSPVNYIADLEIVDPIRKKPLYYQFNLESFGWFNVQKFLETDQTAKESLMLVRVKGSYNEKLNVYLVIPSMKMVAEGSILDIEKNTYGFYSKDGTVILPQNTNAFVLAMQEMKDSIAFAKKEFVTGNAQYFDLSLSKARKSSFNQQINATTATQSNIQVTDNRNNTAIRRKIKDITDAEELKPRNCNCSCFTIQPVDAVTSMPKPSTRVLPARKDSIITEPSAKVEPKKLSTAPIKKIETKKTTNTKTSTKKKPVSTKKKKPLYKPRIAKR